jgi:dipeptidase E
VRLYLSSYKFGTHPEKFAELFGKGNKVAVISNALDVYSDGPGKDERTVTELEVLQGIGLQPDELDLRKYFGKVGELATQLSNYDGVWVRGGNSFVLNQAMKKSGFSEIIKKRLVDNAIVYGGYSAGVVTLSDDLRGIEIVDNPKDIPDGYDERIEWDGLGIIPYHLAVHYKSDHPESEAIDRVVEYFIAHDITYRTLTDGEVIIINGNHEEVVK